MRKATLTFTLIAMLLFSSATALLTVKAEDDIIVVPDDYPTISEALTNALDGSTVFVREGTYTEETLSISKTVTLRGEDANATIIHNPSVIQPWDMSLSPFPPSRAIAIQVNANNVKISGFSITGNAIPINILADGAQIVSNIIDSIEIEGNNNIISQNRIKTYVNCHGSYNSFMGNPLIGGGSDGVLIDGDHNVVYNNNLKDCSIELYGDSNVIAKNSGYFSLTLISSSNNIVYGNRFSGDLGLSGFNNKFYENEISTISISTGGSLYANNNSFYENNILGHNSFLGRFPALWVQSKEPGLLVWDNGKVGNYWKSYQGVDGDGDGVGDLPYNVTAGYQYFDGGFREQAIIDCGQDKFPVMETFNISSVPIKLPNWVVLDLGFDYSILVLSPENQTYNSSSLSLNFTTPKYHPRLVYCLDGKENLTITGNITISGLSNGLHNITVYTQDAFGNTESPNTISFAVAKAEETLPSGISLTLIIIGAISAIVVCVLLYNRRRLRPWKIH